MVRPSAEPTQELEGGVCGELCGETEAESGDLAGLSGVAASAKMGLRRVVAD